MYASGPNFTSSIYFITKMQFLVLLIEFRDKCRFTVVEVPLSLTMGHYEGQRKSGRLKRAEKWTFLTSGDEANVFSKKLIIYHKDKAIIVAEDDNVLSLDINQEETQ